MTFSTVDPALATTFAAFEGGDVRWCLLRGEGELDEPREDVDLLVAATDISAAAAILGRLGYLQLPAWGRGSHRFFLAYDADGDRWTKLDIVTRLSFGRYGEFETDAAVACIARRVAVGGGRAYLLDEVDRFWALFLHCLLDRGAFPPRHRERLAELAKAADGASPLADWFDERAGHTNSRAVATAIREGEWRRLAALGGAMRSAMRRKDAGALASGGRRAALQRLTKVRTLLFGRGMSVALLGPDGAGKSTLAKGLAETFYFPVRTVYMGLYGQGAGRRPPRGLLGRLRRQWGGYLRGVVHAARGRLVVYDRWGYDARLGASETAGLRSRIRRWLLANALPAPDLVILLDAPPELLLARKGEHDVELLRLHRGAYLELAKSLPHAHVVAADRDPDTVRREVTKLIWDCMRSRRGTPPGKFA